jgi:hypothetical protein
LPDSTLYSNETFSTFCFPETFEKWDDVAHAIRYGRVWCIKAYRFLFLFFSIQQRRLTQVMDYHCIIPPLKKWRDTMVLCFVAVQMQYSLVMFPWKMANPGKGDTANAVLRADGGDDVNLVQQAYCNGHYGFEVKRCRTCCKLMACVTLSHVHYFNMMYQCYRHPQCLP